MSKYGKMLEVNHEQSLEKIQRAKLTILEMIEEEDKVTVPKLMQKTGLSRGFFYKNPEVRKAVDRALQLQAGMVDKRRMILDMDNRQLKRMISAEAYTYAISGLIVGCGIGLPLSRFLYNRLITHYFGIEWSFPNLWFGSIVAFIFISAIVSVYAPSKRIRNMAITETINEW